MIEKRTWATRPNRLMIKVVFNLVVYIVLSSYPLKYLCSLDTGLRCVTILQIVNTEASAGITLLDDCSFRVVLWLNSTYDDVVY